MNDLMSLSSNAMAAKRIDGGLESLTSMTLGAKEKKSDKQLRDTANQFEEVIIRQLLKEMRKTVPNNGFIERSHATEMYMEMVDDHMSKQLADANAIGIGDIIYDEMKQKNDSIVNPDEINESDNFINLNGDKKVNTDITEGFIPLESQTDPFMKLHNEKRMIDLPQSKDPYMPIDRKLKVASDRITNL